MTTMVRLLITGIAILITTIVPARADLTNCTGTITSLPFSITIPGVWCLKSNLSISAAHRLCHQDRPIRT